MPGQEAPARAEGLLEQIADTALDDDYYVVRSGELSPKREFNTVLTAVVLAVFAILVTVAALQTRSDRPATQRERSTLIEDISSRKALLASRETTADRLRQEVERLTASVGRFDPALQDLRVQTGDQPAQGPGVTIDVRPGAAGDPDAPITDHDLQIMVNGLWYAGAEAVSINGQRISTLSAIHSAGGVINVNYRDIGPPYTVVALGDEETLADRFAENPAGLYWAGRRKDAGVQIDVKASTELSVEATPRGRVTLRHAEAIKGDA